MKQDLTLWYADGIAGSESSSLPYSYLLYIIWQKLEINGMLVQACTEDSHGV